MLLFSLAGIPPLAGFFAKFYVFLAAIQAGLFSLAVIGVLASVVGAFYYLRIVKVMYFDEPVGKFDPMRRELRMVLASRASSISCSSSIRARWSAPRRLRRSRFSRWHFRSVHGPNRRATGSQPSTGRLDQCGGDATRPRRRAGPAVDRRRATDRRARPARPRLERAAR